MQPRAGPRASASPGLAAASIAAAAGLAWLYAASSATEADLLAFSSGIFDMDVKRVVADLATGQPAWRASVHPLQKLLVAPIGRLLDGALFGGADPLGAARLLIAGCMALQTLAAAALARQLAGGAVGAAVATGAVVAFSFSTWLAASVPESAAVASLATTGPLLFLNVRWGRRFSAGEVGIWAALGAVGLGLTVTQVVHTAIALGVRATLGRPTGADAGGTPARPWRWVLCAAALSAALFAGGLALDARVHPARAGATANPLATELHFARFDRLAAAPLAHTGELLAHFLVVDFVAPFPATSDFLIRLYRLDYWSLSLEEAGADQWAWPQRLLALAVVLAVLAAGRGLRLADPRWLAPSLSVVSQFALHLVYGREYILYSPHWHGVLVALLAAAAWRRYPRRHVAMTVAALLLAVALFANDRAVMARVYAEVDAGLSVGVRDAAGALRSGG